MVLTARLRSLPGQNATIAWMYGPLVLAGVGVESDIFVPHGGDARAPAAFLRRNSTSTLEFEAVGADGRRMRMIPLRDVTTERYVVYFYTAGTKPPQPSVHYCPHSAPTLGAHAQVQAQAHTHAHGESGGEESGGEEAGDEHGEHEHGDPPSLPPLESGGRGRGVQWHVTPAGQMLSTSTL